MDNNKNENKYLYWFEAEDESKNKRKFCLLKPTRRLKEEGELFYASKLSQFISAGVLPKIVWDKVFKNNGGIISDSDQKEYSDLFIEFAEFKNLMDELSSKSAKDRTKEESEKIQFFESRLVMIRKRMQELEIAQINAFENTAEAKARNKTIVWWAANLAVEEDSVSGVSLLLGSGSIESKLDLYDSIMESDKFLADCFSRLNYLVTVWYLGSANEFKEFQALDAEFVNRLAEDEASDPELIEDAQPADESKPEEKEEEKEAEVVQGNKEEAVS